MGKGSKTSVFRFGSVGPKIQSNLYIKLLIKVVRKGIRLRFRNSAVVVNYGGNTNFTLFPRLVVGLNKFIVFF